MKTKLVEWFIALDSAGSALLVAERFRLPETPGLEGQLTSFAGFGVATSERGRRNSYTIYTGYRDNFLGINVAFGGDDTISRNRSQNTTVIATYLRKRITRLPFYSCMDAKVGIQVVLTILARAHIHVYKNLGLIPGEPLKSIEPQYTKEKYR